MCSVQGLENWPRGEEEKGLCTSKERELQLLEGRRECWPLPLAGSMKPLSPAGSMKPLPPAGSMKLRLPVVCAGAEVQSEEAEDPKRAAFVRAGRSQHGWWDPAGYERSTSVQVRSSSVAWLCLAAFLGEVLLVVEMGSSRFKVQHTGRLSVFCQTKIIFDFLREIGVVYKIWSVLR